MRVACPCGRSFEVDNGLAGRRIRCSCGRILTVGSNHVYEPPAPATKASPSNRPTRQSGKKSHGRLAVLFIAVFVIGVVFNYISDSGAQPAHPAGQQDAPAVQNPPVSAACDPAEMTRPNSGTELGGPVERGNGRLTIDNGTALDAVAVLVDDYSGQAHRAIYIRSHTRGLFTGVLRGRYSLRFELGEDWLVSRQFCDVRGISEFEEPLEFTETRQNDSILYATYEVTLHSVAGGTARTEPIPAADFVLPPLQ